MQGIITVRLHLDRANLENGALQLIRASHHKILNSGEIASLVASSKPVVCKVDSGDALVMSPLILHRSAKAKFNSAIDYTKQRAIVHLEYTHGKLPNNLQWV